MSKKKGLSIDEKKTKLLEIFYEKKEFFQLKELEKLGPKEKGIVSQSVKEVLQSLVDDNLVDSEKIGTSIYFWAFPGKAKNEKSNKLNALTRTLQENKKKLEECENRLEKEKSGRESDTERSEILQDLAQLNEKLGTIQKELTKYSHVDPEILVQYRNDIEETGDAVNRWTDNIFAARGWCKKKMCVEEKLFNQQFGIPQDLDYIEIE